MASRQKTFEVEHPGAHDATPDQLAAAFRAAIKGSDAKPSGEVTYNVTENVSGDRSKVTANFDQETEPVHVKGDDPAPAKK